MGLHLLGSNDPGNLTTALTRYLDGALAELPAGDERVLIELPVIVPDRARRDWLREAIARQRGICAGIRICLHNEFIEQVLAPTLGVTTPRWQRALARAALLPHVTEFPALHAALGREAHGTLGARAWSLSGDLIEGFDRIALHRLEHQGRVATDLLEAVRATCPGQPWRSELWQRIAGSEIGDPVRWQQDLETAIATQAHRLPPRIAVVESSGPSQAAWRIFAALAAHCDVLLLGITPTWGNWDWVRRWADTGSEAVGEGLLASWGTAARRVASTALELGASDLRLEGLAREPHGDGLLADLQRALLHPDRPAQAPGPGPITARSAARTLSFHDAIGMRRQLEVVRHELARLIAADATIAMHEIAILCPDPQAIEMMARAIFASPDEGPVLELQRRTRQQAEEDVLEVAMRLVDLLPSRWPASAVLDLLGHPLVQIHHPIDLERLRRWLDAADLRWGVDAQHQQELGVPSTGLGTWRRGLLRLELAIWHGEEVSDAMRWPGEGDDPGVVPAPGIQEEDIPLVRALTVVLRPLLEAARLWRTSQPPAFWCTSLESLLDGLVGSGPERSTASQLLGAWHGSFRAARTIPLMSPDTLRTVLTEGIQRPGVRLSGGLTLGSVSELGGLPWRIAALIGMDDGAFPRQITVRDLDPLSLDRRSGDPDARADDRLRLLQTVCTVRDHLLVTWSGRDPIKGEPLPAAPVIQELLELATKLTGVPREHLVIRHRLHAAHERPSAWPSEALRQQAWAFAQAQPASGRRVNDGAPRPAQPLQVPELSTLTLDEFLRTWKNPPDAFLRALGSASSEGASTPRDHELFALDTLEAWQLDQRLFAGTSIERLTAEGVLPPPPFSHAHYGKRRARHDDLGAWRQRLQDRLEEVRVDLALCGVRVVGVLGNVLPGVGPLVARTSTPSARHLLDHALRTLLWRLAAQEHGGGMMGYTKSRTSVLEIQQWTYVHPRGGDAALAEAMVASTLESRRRPLPIMPNLALAMLEAIGAPPSYQVRDEDAPTLIRQGFEEWTGDDRDNSGVPAERDQESCRRLWPDGESLFGDPAATLQLVELLAPFLSAQAWSQGSPTLGES